VGAVPPGLARPAREFVDASLRYEVGEGTGPVAQALRRTATASFAKELLSSPVAPPASGVPGPAVVTAMHMRVVTLSPPAALVTGVARRPGGPEEFSFVFVQTPAGWRAGGPGE
jgi:hypothetical protein